MGYVKCSNAHCRAWIHGARAKRATGLKTTTPLCGHCALGGRPTPPARLQRQHGEKGMNKYLRRRRMTAPPIPPSIPPIEKKGSGVEPPLPASRDRVLLCGIGFVNADAAAAGRGESKRGTSSAAYRDRQRCLAVEAQLGVTAFSITRNQEVSVCEPRRYLLFSMKYFCSILFCCFVLFCFVLIH
jgi:hypothetical protein